jgi:hypothetical protein
MLRLIAIYLIIAKFAVLTSRCHTNAPYNTGLNVVSLLVILWSGHQWKGQI